MLIHFCRRMLLLKRFIAPRNLLTVVALSALARIVVFCFLALRNRVVQLGGASDDVFRLPKIECVQVPVS